MWNEKLRNDFKFDYDLVWVDIDTQFDVFCGLTTRFLKQVNNIYGNNGHFSILIDWTRTDISKFFLVFQMSSLMPSEGLGGDMAGYQTITILPQEMNQNPDMNYVLIMTKPDGSTDHTAAPLASQIVDLKVSPGFVQRGSSDFTLLLVLWHPLRQVDKLYRYTSYFFTFKQAPHSCSHFTLFFKSNVLMSLRNCLYDCLIWQAERVSNKLQESIFQKIIILF